MKVGYIIRKALSFLGFFLITALIVLMCRSCETEKITIHVDVQNDRNLNEYLTGNVIDTYTMEYNYNNADILIRDHSDKEIDGYVKIDNALMSTIVLMFNNNFLQSGQSGGFFQVTSNCYKTDLIAILNAIENDSSWESLGYHPNVVDGNVVLTIPSQSNPYYDAVVETIYFALNNFKELSDSDRTTLKPRVDAIIAKCKTVPDIHTAVINSGKADDKVVYLGPEYIFRNVGGYGYFGTDNSDYYLICFEDFITFTADIYVRQDENSVVQGRIDGFIQEIYSHTNFASMCGWRVVGASYDVPRNLRSYLYSNIA